MESYASTKKIDIIFTSNKKLDKLSKKIHQGALAQIEPFELVDFNHLLKENDKKKKSIFF